MNTQKLQAPSLQTFQPSIKQKASNSWWQRIGDRLAVLFQSQEIIATELQDEQGAYWHLYDPNTNTFIEVRSQQEALTWLEQRSGQSVKMPHDYFSRDRF